MKEHILQSIKSDAVAPELKIQQIINEFDAFQMELERKILSMVCVNTDPQKLISFLQEQSHENEKRILITKIEESIVDKIRLMKENEM